MAHIVQLSDLHLGPDTPPGLVRTLGSALRRHVEARGSGADLLVITGDVFDSATWDPRDAVRAFLELHAEVDAALGGEVPLVVVPGNHDRRAAGLMGPHREELFHELGGALGTRAWVHGRDTPFLAALVPRSVHGLPLSLIAYDSTFLPSGLFSAGGVIQQEDVLFAAAAAAEDPPSWPVLFLLHHHLVPTPLTDLGKIDAARGSGLVRWTVERLLPRLVAHGDHEELTMTALGAGTALSTLQALGRAVLVLHGHKHYPTARLLTGTHRGHGDVLLVSAGSAGRAERWNGAGGTGGAALWPSFNAVSLTLGELAVDAVSFGHKGSSAGTPVRWPLLRATQQGPRWLAAPVEHDPLDRVGPALSENVASFRLLARASDRDHWDAECTRQVHRSGSSRPREYVETLRGVAGSKVEVLDPPDRRSESVLPSWLRLVLGGAVTYRLEAGLCRTLGAARRHRGSGATPYEWVGLMNRYHAAEARLSLSGPPDLVQRTFGSITDLGTGLEAPLAVRRAPGVAILEQQRCAPRTLLRLYWPLEH